MSVKQEEIKRMVDRFLSWKLPADFNPDAGINYKPPPYFPGIDSRPSGTNLFSATQAEEMVRYMLDGHIPMNYERISHDHCWNQKRPSACGIALAKHTQCCLCDLPIPMTEEKKKCPYYNEDCPKCHQPTTEEDSWEAEFDRMWPNQKKSREDLMALFGNEYKPHTATEAAILDQAENKRRAFKLFIRRVVATAKEEAKQEVENKISGLINSRRNDLDKLELVVAYLNRTPNKS